jgi:hypothetical protein
MQTEQTEVQEQTPSYTIETAGETTTAEQETTVEAKTETTEAEKPKKKPKAQVRIENLSHKLKDSNIENAELKERIAEFEASKEPQKPDIDDYDDYEEYSEKEKEYEKFTESKSEEQESEKEKPSDFEFESVLEEVDAKFDDTRELYSDFDDVVKNSESGVTFTKDMVETLNEIENSGEVAYSLGKDVKESNRIANLSPKKQIAAIIKLGMKLEKEPYRPKEKKQTKATEPIIPNEGAGGNRERGLSDAENFKQYKEMRQENIQSNNGW